MRILIVDDEPLVRIGLKSVIDWKGNGMEIVGEAADGAEALERIAELKPDVVFLDIKMPKKDGIAVMKEMRQLGSAAKVIILSSFDDIAYVKEAMKLGARDYFHKPAMNEQEIAAVLKEIQRESAGSGAYSKQPGAAAAQSSKADALWEGLRGNGESLHKTGLKEAGIYVVLFSIKHYSAVMKRYSPEQPHILPDAVDNIAAEVLSNEKETEYLRIDDRLSAILISNSDLKSLLASLNRVNGLVQRMAAALKRFVNIDVIFGISDWFSSFAGMETGYAQARTALEQKFYQPDPSVFYFSFCKPADPSSLEQAGKLLASMKNALRDGDFKTFKEILTDWEQLLERTHCMNGPDARKVYDGLLFMLDENIQPAAEETAEWETFAELSSWFRRILDRILEEKEGSELKSYSLLVRNIIRYLQEHFAEDLSLKLLAEQFHVSPNYISRLFKQEAGRGIFEYINEIRIDKAKALLKDYRYKIYEVAEMTGFNSQTHFSTVFQRHTGLSPKEYRNDEG